MERQGSARLALACLEAAGGGTINGGERSKSIWNHVSARLELALLNAARGGERGGGESGAIAAIEEMAAPADGARGRWIRKAERGGAERRAEQ